VALSGEVEEHAFGGGTGLRGGGLAGSRRKGREEISACWQLVTVGKGGEKGGKGPCRWQRKPSPQKCFQHWVTQCRRHAFATCGRDRDRVPCGLLATISPS
jgi:hypothetical protein